MARSPKIVAAVAACLILGLAPAQADRVTGLPSKEGAPLSAFSGEVVVRANFDMVVAALDEPGPDGKTDGQVDQLFYLYSGPGVFPLLSFWDAEGKVELHEDGLRVILPQHGQILDFWFGSKPRPRRGGDPSYKAQGVLEAFQLFRHSGPAVNRLSMLEVVQWKGWDLHDNVKTIVPPLHPDPNPDAGGGGCALTCTKSCLGGSCSAICNQGFCAQCKCVGDPPVNTECGCYFKTQ